MNRKSQAEQAFAAGWAASLYQSQQKFLNEVDFQYVRSEKYTEEELNQKGLKLKSLMDGGMSFSEAIDNPEVYVGSFDGEYLYETNILKTNTDTYSDWVYSKMIAEAKSFINNFFKK